MFKDARTKKLLIAVIATLFGLLMMPHSESAIASVFIFPSVMAGIAFGIAIAQLFELTKKWSDAGMNNTNAKPSEANES